MIDEYRRKYAYAEDYGTSHFKFGPVAERPYVIENRGVITSELESKVLLELFGVSKPIVVGEEVSRYLPAVDTMGRALIYPMHDGLVERGNERAWAVIKEITRYGFEKSLKEMKKAQDFDGFYVTAALSAIAPRHMYERLFDIHAELDKEGRYVKAVTIIPQPLAVAIAEKITECIVVESGHGNTQVTPIVVYPVRDAITVLNRGGAEADAIAAEILRDLGYEDRAREEKFVRMFKESVGLVPRDLDLAIEKAKKEPERFRVVFKVPRTTIEIDMGSNSWMRFLIGEIIFDPNHEIYESYYKRGMPRPRDTVVGDQRLPGTLPLIDAIRYSIGRTSFEAQQQIRVAILSGGNFAWKVPQGLEDVAVNSAEKVALQLRQKGLDYTVKLVSDPLYSVWKGGIVYSLAVPDTIEWNWGRMEGWYKRGVHY
ncbi:MAG: hypothetical protein QXU72_05220 [Thermofilum sp.]